jgi:hypothetical protein
MIRSRQLVPVHLTTDQNSWEGDVEGPTIAVRGSTVSVGAVGEREEHAHERDPLMLHRTAGTGSAPRPPLTESGDTT